MDQEGLFSLNRIIQDQNTLTDNDKRSSMLYDIYIGKFKNQDCFVITQNLA